MRKPLFGLLATAAIAFGACQGAATPSPSASAAAASPSAGASASASAAASPSPSAGIDVNQILYGAKYSPAKGTPGGKVIVGDWQAPDQLNPYFTNAFANSEVFAMTLRTGLVVSADGHYIPDLFQDPLTYDKSVTKDTSGTGFTVHAVLKPGEMWSDGQPLTMNDYKFTWQWVQDKGQTGITTLGWENVDTVTVSTDGLSADFHFKAPFGGWIGTIGGDWPLPEHFIKTIAVKDAGKKTYPLDSTIKNSPTNGAFKFVTASPDTIVLARNDNYKDGQACDGGKPCLDQVTFKAFPNNKDGEIAAFKAGEIDLADDLQTADYTAIKDVDPTVGKALINPAWEYEHLDLNQGAGMSPAQAAKFPNKALADPIVRKAIAQAIDKKALYQTIFPGYPVPDQKVCSAAVPGINYWALPDDQANCPTFDVAAAKSALDAAGYKAGADGIRVDPKTNKPLAFEHCTSTAAVRKTSGEFLAKSLQAIGIKLNLNFVDSTAILFASWGDVAADAKCSLWHGNYDTAEYAYVLSFDLFGDYYYSYHKEQIPTDANKGNGNNTLHVDNADLTAAIDVLKNAINPQDQLVAAFNVQKIVEVTGNYEIPLYYRSAVRGVAANLGNFFQNPGTYSDMWNIQDWYLTK
jgi:peptide/nickel transport system substrate-binding protein